MEEDILSWEKQIYRKQGLKGIIIYFAKAFFLGAIFPGTILWALLDRKGLLRWLTNGVVTGKDKKE